MTDTQLLDWLENNQGYALVGGDRGHWACTCQGFQNLPEGVPADIQTTFWIEKDQWCKSIRSAIKKAIEETELVSISLT